VIRPLADAHLHLFPHGYPGSLGAAVMGQASEIDAYETLRRTHDIVAGLVVGYEADGIDPENNNYIRALAAERPWMATLAYVPVDPAPSVDRLSAWLDGGHVGLAVYLPDAAAASAFVAWPTPCWAALERRRAILSLNARPEAIGRLEGVVRGHAGCSFLFSHLGLPGRHAAVPSEAAAAGRLRTLMDLADCANVCVKISGLYAVSDPPQAHPHDPAKPFVELLLARFGAGRCLWGSDFSPALEFVTFEETIAIPWLDGLSPEEHEQVMGRNLLKLLGREGR
jgi:L-fuconolactonase